MVGPERRLPLFELHSIRWHRTNKLFARCIYSRKYKSKISGLSQIVRQTFVFRECQTFATLISFLFQNLHDEILWRQHSDASDGSAHRCLREQRVELGRGIPNGRWMSRRLHPDRRHVRWPALFSRKWTRISWIAPRLWFHVIIYFSNLYSRFQLIIVTYNHLNHTRAPQLVVSLETNVDC